MLISQATLVMAGFKLSPCEYNNSNNNNIIISDEASGLLCLKGKDTSLRRGASKIKTRSVTVTWGFVNWEWQCQISPNTSKIALA